MRRTRLLPAFAAGVAAALLAAGCGSDGDKGKSTSTGTPAAATASVSGGERLTVYLSLSFEGADQPASESIRNSAELAIEQAGAEAGGHPVTLVALDDALPSTGVPDASLVRENARTAADDPNAIAYIGDQDEDDTAVSLPITNAAGLLQVSPTNTYPGLTQTGGPDRREPGRYYPSGKRTFGRIVPTDKVQAAAQLELVDQLGCRATGVLDDGSADGRSLAAALAAGARGAGVTLGHVADANLAEGDGSAAVADVARGAPDCVIYAGSGGERAVRLWGALHGELPTARLIGPDQLATQDFAQRIGQAGPLTYLTTPTVASKYLDEAGRDYLATYQSRFGSTPDAAGIYGYETMRAVLAAVGAAGREPSRADVVAEWFAIRGRASALGPYSITSTGDSTLTRFGVYHVAGGTLVFDRVLDASAAAGAAG